MDLEVPESAAMSSIVTSGPFSWMRCRATSSSSARLSSRWRAQRADRPSTGACVVAFTEPRVSSTAGSMQSVPQRILRRRRSASDRRDHSVHEEVHPVTHPALPRDALILGGNRIPFARAGGPYAGISNQDMLTAALEGLVARFGLQGEKLGEVAGGAVLKLAGDLNLD